MMPAARTQRPRWRFLAHSPLPYNPSTRPGGRPDVPWGRAWALARDDGRRADVEVEADAAALAAYTAGTIPESGRLAIQSEGRSAVDAHIGKASLPERIRITRNGLRRSA